MRPIWNTLREVEWYAVIAIALLVVALLLAVLIALGVIEPLLWVLAVCLTQTAIVAAVFSHRT